MATIAINEDSGVSPATSPYPLVHVRNGSGTQAYYPPGLLYSTLSAVSTGADTLETTLASYSLPAGQLSANGQAIEIEAAGEFAANANVKTVKIYFGSHSFVLNQATAAPNGVNWFVHQRVVRYGATAQVRGGASFAGVVLQMTNEDSSLTQDLTAAVLVKITGTNGVATAGDIKCTWFTVTYFPY